MVGRGITAVFFLSSEKSSFSSEEPGMGEGAELPQGSHVPVNDVQVGTRSSTVVDVDGAS